MTTREEFLRKTEAAARDRMSAAVNSGTDWVISQLGLEGSDVDTANILANAIGTAWDREGSTDGLTWAEFIAENWSAEPGSPEDPATW